MEILRTISLYKDVSDLDSLIRSGKTGLNDEELKSLCEKYATIELYEKLKKR